MRQPGPLTACAYTAVKETFEAGRLENPQKLAREIAEFWVTKCQGKLVYPTDTNMFWPDLSNQRFTLDDLRIEGQKRGLRISRERLVLHYRRFCTSKHIKNIRADCITEISREAVDSLKEIMLELASGSLEKV